MLQNLEFNYDINLNFIFIACFVFYCIKDIFQKDTGLISGVDCLPE